MLVAGDASARASDYEGKITLRLLVGVTVAATGGMLFGYDLGVTGRGRNIHDIACATQQWARLVPDIDCCWCGF